MEQHLIYISLCIKPDDLLLYLRCFSEEQKSAILSEKNLIKASRKTLEMLLHNVEEPGRFVELRDALSENDGYPNIVRILDGDCNPKDQNYAKVVELFTRGIIVRLNPSELLPHLLQKGVFKQKDVGEIRAEEKNHGKMKAACVLLMYLPRRIADWFRCFLQVLIKCDLEDIAEMLDTDMFKDIKLTQTNEQGREVISIKAPQLKMNDNLSSESNLNAKTKLSGKLDDAIASETELRFMRNDKVASNEEPNAPVLESNSANRNDQTLANEMIHESEPEVYNLKKMQRYAICEMACGRRITVMKGSLVDLRVDVMVNTTDGAVSLTSGLAKAISEKGGEKIRRACYKYFQTQGSIDEGEVFVSEAGGLPAKHVVDVNSPIKREGTEDELRLLRETVMKAMMEASVRKAQTIALPAISCGMSGFPTETATRQIVHAVRNYFRMEQSSSLKHVYLVAIIPKTAKSFQEALCCEFEDDTKCTVEVVKES
ncbi:uncharacterized protein LOC128554299 [Mercenaria mercenaria]|uniref:uncharacterized protein LOC128554299 n=1 Tax=Mercenaria mercenaria TaxID=6596 RepID=UPI00234E4709|nr:uncharacterized protein LOC128554299 [Mercenaria mercenaria]